jgi:glycosyltransferase involved in cell wall biosynthesis
MKKLIVVCGYTPSLVNFRLDLMLRFKQEGFDVLALGPSKDERTEAILNANGLKFQSYSLERNGYDVFSDIRTVQELRKIFIVERPSVIFSYTIKPVFYSSLASSFLGIKKLALFSGLGFYAMENRNIFMGIAKVIMTLLLWLISKQNIIFIFQNKDDKNFLENLKFPKITFNHIITNGSGVNLEAFTKQNQIHTEKINFLFIGRLNESKGIGLFLESAKRLSCRGDCTFTVVGMMDENSSDAISESTLFEYHDSGVIDFKGETRDVRPYLKKCNVFVLPSYYREGVPRTLLEALAVGRPIITTDNVGCKETVVNGINGLLIPKRNLGELISAMLFFLENPDKLDSFSLEARLMAENKFDVNLVNNAIVRLIHN